MDSNMGKELLLWFDMGRDYMGDRKGKEHEVDKDGVFGDQNTSDASHC